MLFKEQQSLVGLKVVVMVLNHYKFEYYASKFSILAIALVTGAAELTEKWVDLIRFISSLSWFE